MHFRKVCLLVCDVAGRVRHWVGFFILQKPTRFCGTLGSDSCVIWQLAGGFKTSITSVCFLGIVCSPVSHSCCILSAQQVCWCWMSSGVCLLVCDVPGRVRHWVGFFILRKPTRFCGTRGSDSCVCSHYPQIFLKIQHCTSKARLCKMTIWNTVSTHKNFPKIKMALPRFLALLFCWLLAAVHLFCSIETPSKIHTPKNF